MVEFLFKNQKICGNPFSDAQWVPILDMCEIECEKISEICVENDDAKQRCNKLPSKCVDSYRARLTTTPRPTSSPSAKHKKTTRRHKFSSAPKNVTNRAIRQNKQRTKSRVPMVADSDAFQRFARIV